MDETVSSPAKLIDVRELAQQLNVPVSWLYERTRGREIPCVRLGKYIRFDLQEVLNYFKEKQTSEIA